MMNSKDKKNLTQTEIWRRANEEYVEKLRREKNIILLDEFIINTKHRHNWKCGICNHIWGAKLSYLIYDNRSCGKCLKKESDKIRIQNLLKEIKNVKTKRNIICLDNDINELKEIHSWRCNICNYTWKTTVSHIINDNSGCRKCRTNKLIEITKTRIDNLKVERNIKCLDKYKNNINIKHNWKCLICNYAWSTSANNVLNNKSGCKKCSSGKSEEMLRKIFENMFINKKFETTRALDILRYKKGRNLELDGYNNDMNLAFEYAGIQHYIPSFFHHGPSAKLIEKNNMNEANIKEYINTNFSKKKNATDSKKRSAKKTI